MRSVRRIRSIVKRKTAADCRGLLNFQESKRLLVGPADGGLLAALADDQRVGTVRETLEVDGVVALAIDIGHLLYACAESIIDIHLHETCVLGRKVEHRAVHAGLEAVCNLADRLDCNRGVDELLVFLHVDCRSAIADDDGDSSVEFCVSVGFRSVCGDNNDCVRCAGDESCALLGDVFRSRLAIVSVGNRSLAGEGCIWEAFGSDGTDSDLLVLERIRDSGFTLLVFDFKGVLHCAEARNCGCGSDDFCLSEILEVEHPDLLVLLGVGAVLVGACGLADINNCRIERCNRELGTFACLVIHREDVVVGSVAVKVESSAGR